MTEIGIAVVEHAGRFLVGRRPPGKPLAGLAEFPGGKCEPGEPAKNCAARECLEETGLLVRPVHHVASVASGSPDQEETLNLHFWLCEPDQPDGQPRPPFRWVERRELKALPFPNANAEVVSALMEGRRHTTPTHRRIGEPAT